MWMTKLAKSELLAHYVNVMGLLTQFHSVPLSKEKILYSTSCVCLDTYLSFNSDLKQKRKRRQYSALKHQPTKRDSKGYKVRAAGRKNIPRCINFTPSIQSINTHMALMTVFSQTLLSPAVPRGVILSPGMEQGVVVVQKQTGGGLKLLLK